MGTFCCGTSLTSPGRTGLGPVATSAGPAPIPPGHARLFAPVRARLWELPAALHCSVVGTCLSTAQLHRLLSRLQMVRQADTDHDLHGRAVALAGQQTAASRHLGKLLDTTHAVALRAFARAETEAALRRLWDEALDRGDIPGPYWAVLTHPAGSYGLRQEAFGRVHMLSHLVGAANRADLRRLAALEDLNAGLAAKTERQQARLRQVVETSNGTIRALRDALSARPGPATARAALADPGTAALQGVVDELRRRLDGSERRVAAMRTRLDDTVAALAAERAERARLERRADGVDAELAAMEAALPGDRAATPPVSLPCRSLLYVGGRPQAVAAMHDLALRAGAGFLHHDGGMEAHTGLLAGLVSRADLVLFPVDCISHEAAIILKRLCRNGGKRFVPLRSSGVGSFLAALRTVAGEQRTAA